MLIEKKNTADLLPADYNPRKDLKPGDKEYEKLKRSIEQFGYVEPVIWNKTTGRVVGGHQRLKVLIDMGMTEVDCVVVELSEEKEKALNVALNKISGEWDNDKLALLIADLQGTDFDVSLTGFEPAELEALFREDTKKGVHDDDFDVEAELQKPTFSKAGDLWQHEPVLFGWKKAGKHQWYTGRKETTIWEFDKPKKNGDHPTMKPIPLLAYPIMNSSMANSLVLDPFGGSGSTLIACEQTNRICYTIELDEKFCDVIVKRYIEQVGSAAGVTVVRDGLTYNYEEIASA